MYENEYNAERRGKAGSVSTAGLRVPIGIIGGSLLSRADRNAIQEIRRFHQVIFFIIFSGARAGPFRSRGAARTFTRSVWAQPGAKKER
jgi:hypothetical protein